MTVAVLATCNLNQWAMDFAGNSERTCQSIKQARGRGARYRLGPELETSGYGCEDHFLEMDTFTHSWECIASLISQGYTDDMFIDIGAPIMHRDVAYNCRVLIVNRQILLIRPKSDLADHGNYREPRWFRAWPCDRALEQFHLPAFVSKHCDPAATHVPIGHAIIELSDGSTIGCETCEELWTPQASHISLALSGVQIIGNGSASHHVLRKLHTRLELLQSATRKSGGAYLYANQLGCDGGRLYYDGSALIALNGDVLAIGSQFSIDSEVQVITANIDLTDITSYRSGFSARGVQAARHQALVKLPSIKPSKNFDLADSDGRVSNGKMTLPLREIPLYKAEEEIARGPACWLWDYLRRSGMNGFFLPLSGGADSSATATIVGAMCQVVVSAARKSDADPKLVADVRRVAQLRDEDDLPQDGRSLANRLLHTAYMPCDKMSSVETRERARDIADQVGAFHVVADISNVVAAVLNAFTTVFGEKKTPQFRSKGGSSAENLALQNVQARVRMVIGYLIAQLGLWARGRQGSLLVLGSANVDECLRGYVTKYDCSAADINPIGGISKNDLRRFLKWAARPVDDGGLGYPALIRVVDAAPTAELEPFEDGYAQTDEIDMGMRYDELWWYGRLRKLGRCGPLSMFHKLVQVWLDQVGSLEEIAEKVKFFFKMYSINRHKVTTLTPSYHAEDYSPEDNRFDLRPFLYNRYWIHQFGRIDEAVEGEKCMDAAVEKSGLDSVGAQNLRTENWKSEIVNEKHVEKS